MLPNRERLVKSFMEMVRIDSPSLCEGDFAAYLEEKFTSLGFAATMDVAGDIIGGNCGNLLLRFQGSSDKKPLLLNAHMDTVDPSVGIKPLIDADYIVSSGETILGADDKAAAASILEAVTALTEAGEALPPLEILFTIAEEKHLLGSKNFDLSSLRAAYGFTVDCNGPVGSMITAAPSQITYKVDIRGKAAHAGINPQDGLNAIALAAKAIGGLSLGRLDEETTANIGLIEGGLATNIVPEKTTLQGEMRSHDAAKLERLLGQTEKAFTALAACGAEVAFEHFKEYSSFVLAEDAYPVRLAKEACRALGVEPRTVSTGGGSDANIFNAKGIAVANLACGMDNIHSTSERIAINDLYLTTGLLCHIITFERDGSLSLQSQ